MNFSKAQQVDIYISQEIWMIFAPCYILLGTIGNLFVLIIFCKKCMHDVVNATFMILSALVDFAILYTSLLAKWLKYTEIIDWDLVPDLICKLQLWLSTSFGMMEPWIVVVITVQRGTMLLQPFRNLGVSKNVSNDLVKVFSMVMFIFLINLHLMHGSFDGDVSVITFQRTYCYGNDSHYLLFLKKWEIARVFFVLILPTGIFFVFDIVIVYQLKMCSCLGRSSRQETKPSSEVAHNASRSMKYILILNIVFLVTSFPTIFVTMKSPSETRDEAENFFLLTVTSLLLYTRNAAGFLAFIASGKFRREVTKIYRNCKSNLFSPRNMIKPLEK
ncbi:uncharacterized protein LOC106873270 [Octopus bimaculoides]|uniref:G-protein coupled receptors family 1 profile domain-containing protein n=1 Tax=Octopus bimaculoides TaxID=37653 RepID=A0A0L8H226_OCTBM|nr:uncharacterized protein LOC106873270 [Octopus bimaculoides]|eukprot:XP_014776049.1 PREDICTED: uncharacterized protein LOC106873270 [Octopus bimaculoides]